MEVLGVALPVKRGIVGCDRGFDPVRRYPD